MHLLDRDPKTRLGAGPGDSEELKSHKFFETINWENALNRKLKLPIPTIKPIVEVQMMFKTGQSMEDEEGQYKRMEKWSFIGNDFM